MYSKAQIEALELLDKYFSETPESTIQADIKAVTELNFVGSSAKEYFYLFHKYLNYEPFKSELPTSQSRIRAKQPIENGIPKVNSVSDIFNPAADFLYFNHPKLVFYPPIEYNYMDINKNPVQYSKK